MKRINITLSLIMIAAVLCLLQTCSKESYHDVKGEQFWREQNEKEILSVTQKYTNDLTRLQTKNDSLTKELKLSEKKLITAKLKQHLSEQKILTLAQTDTSSSVEDQLSKCDSLKSEIIEYVQHVDSTQRLYDSTITQLNSIINLKDTALDVCMTSYERIKEISEDNLRREDRLTDELQKAVKQSKRKSIKNKFLAGGFVILSAILAGILIKGK